MDRKIKLVLLIDVLENVTGGAERQIYEFIKRVDRGKFKLDLFIIHHRDIPKEIKRIANSDKRIDVQGLGIKRIYDIKGIIEGFRFAKFLKRKKIDILMTYHFASDIWGTIFGKFAGVKTIISNRRDAGFWRRKHHILAYKLINRWVTKIIVNSNAVKRMVLQDEKVCEDKIELIYNGVDLERFKVRVDVISKKEELGLLKECKVIGCIGNLRPIKGHKFLIEAAKGIVNVFPNAHFLFIGDGEEKRRLADRVKRLGLEKNIHFLGKREDIPQLIKIMDICILPSLSEGLSNALLEYMASAKPVIATRVGGNVDIIENEKNGILIPAKDINAIVNQIIRLLKDENYTKNLGIKARETVEEKFNLRKQMVCTEEFLEKIARPKKQLEKNNKELRIMHLISSGGLFGAEKVMLSLAKSLNYNGTKSWIGAINNFHNPHLEVIEEAKKVNIPTVVIKSKGKFDITAIKQIIEAIRKFNIDIIHTHNYKANMIGFLAAKKTKVPIMSTLHGYIGNNFKLRCYERIDRFMLRFFNKVVFVDDSLARCLRNGLVNSIVINNGINISSQATGHKTQVKGGLGIKEDELVIGSAGRLSKEKGHRYLIEAFARIVKKHSGVKLLIVGNGLQYQRLVDSVQQLGIEGNVIFAGYQEDMDKVYRGIDILVQPSLREGVPLAILEAMSYGLPVVATNVGGVANLIRNRETGLLINPASSKEIYNALLNLLEDKKLREELGQNAKQFVKENYSLDRMVNSYKRVYQEVLNSS